MGVITGSFNLNISPKMPYGVLECDIVVTELHACDFVIKDCVIKGVLLVPDPVCRSIHIHIYIYIFIF